MQGKQMIPALLREQPTYHPGTTLRHLIFISFSHKSDSIFESIFEMLMISYLYT